MTKPVPDKQYHVQAAIQAADSFRRHAHAFISSLPQDVNEAHYHAARDFGGLISSATTLALAIELYLKALRMVVGLPIPEEHHLWSLYKDLPRELKADFERHYDAQNPREGNYVAALQVAVNPSGVYNEEVKRWSERTETPNHDPSLKAVLRNSSDAFQTWRYIYEVQPKKGLVVIQYDFLRLDLVAHLAREFAVRIFEGRGSRNGRRSQSVPISSKPGI